MKKRKLLALLVSLLPLISYSQGLSLKQCIDFARINNGNIKNAEYDVAISQKKIDEQLGSMLPQVEANSSYRDNLKLQTTALPGELMGKPGETILLKMGTKHNASASVSLNQKIFDPAFGIAMKVAKITQEQSEQSAKQTEEDIVYNVSTTYYQTLVIQKQTEVLKATLDASTKSMASTELKFKNGMANKVDFDKIRVSCNNTKSDLQQSELNYKQSLNTLKYYMGMSVDSIISLSDNSLDVSVQPAETDTFSLGVENRIDYRLQQTNLKLYEMNRKRETSGYLPSLSLNASYDYTAMRNKFNFLDNDQKWLNSYGVGLSLKIPIFDGLQRHARIAQSTLNIQKAEETLRMTEQSIKVDVSNYDIKYRNAVDNIGNEKENLDLAKSVYQNTLLSYQQGISSSLELVQAESSLREAQNHYFNKLLNLYIARIDLEKSKGQLIEFINNSK
jgi:outer membrane protein TolC